MAYLVFKSEASANIFLKSYNQTFIDHIGLVHKPILEASLNQFFPVQPHLQENKQEGSYEQGLKR